MKRFVTGIFTVAVALTAFCIAAPAAMAADADDYLVEKQITAVSAEAVGTVGSNPEYALDGNSSTVYMAEITKDTMADTYLLTELDGSTPISKIEVYKKYGACDTNYQYWADWIMAVGCELQGSFDGETWEQIGVMETWPDEAQRKGDDTKQTVTLSEPKSYKYVRYIRTGWKPDSPNNYGVWVFGNEPDANRLHVADIRFYTEAECVEMDVFVSATAADSDSDAANAVDGNAATAYTLSNQTADTMAEQYLLLETDGTKKIEKIIIRRQYNAGGQSSDNSYWADHCLAVGCELQGSFDGASWETISVMNTWPDNTGEVSKNVYTLQTPKAYTYVRYIRTQYKSGGDYAVWKWSSSDGGNRLNVAEIELYTQKQEVKLAATASDGAVAQSGMGVLRFITTVNVPSSQTVESYGTYILPLKIFETGNTDTARMVCKDASIADGKTYCADLIDIPAEMFDVMVYAWSFAKLENYDDIQTVAFDATSINSQLAIRGE